MHSTLNFVSTFISIFVFGLIASASAAFADNGVELHWQNTIEMRLDQAIVVNGTIHLPENYSGVVNLGLDTKILSQAAPDLKAAVSPESVSTKGGPAIDIPFQVTFVTTPSSHSFQALPISITAKSSSESTPISQASLLTVDPIYEITLSSAAHGDQWNSPMTLSLPKHSPATIIRFVDLDAKMTHRIHGEGAIPHESSGEATTPSSPGRPGFVYEVKIPAGAPVTGYYRCHDHEEDDQLRSISFNN